jgi:hypothetical protein
MWDKSKKERKEIAIIPVEEASIVVADELTTEKPVRKGQSKEYR